MTIQFHCPFCTAPIEVDDSAAGKMGRCPKCAARLTVPGMIQKPPAATAGSPSALSPNEPAGSDAGMVPPPPAIPDFASPLSLDAPASLPGAVPGALPDPSRPSTSRQSVARRVKRKARRRGGWLIPAIFGLAFAGVIAWMAAGQFDWAPLSGEVSATAYDYLDLPAQSLPCDGSRMSDRQLEDALSQLNLQPVALTGDLIQAQIRGEGRNLILSNQNGRKSIWYEVDLRSKPGVMAYIASHSSELEALRKPHVQKARNDFLDVVAKVQSGQEEYSAYYPFRDRLVIPALVQGLGYQMTAVVGNNMFLCMREPEEGLFYFLMPAGVKSFELQGRKQADGKVIFPGKFTVKVTEKKAEKVSESR